MIKSNKMKWSSYTGVMATAIVLIIFQMMDAFGHPFNNPAPIFLMAIAYAAFVGGLKQGLISAEIGFVYMLWFYADSNTFVSYQPENFLRVLVLTIVMPSIAIVVGVMKGVADQLSLQVDELKNKLAYEISSRSSVKEANINSKDSLTDLPNRKGLFQKVNQAIQDSKQDSSIVGILILDLDDFRQINHNYGHDVGDELLKTVSERLIAATRKGDIVGRLEGDEFVVVLVGSKSENAISEGANRLLSMLSDPFRLPNIADDLIVSGKVGTSFYPLDGSDAINLIRKATIELEKAKSDKNGDNLLENDQVISEL